MAKRLSQLSAATLRRLAGYVLERPDGPPYGSARPSQGLHTRAGAGIEGARLRGHQAGVSWRLALGYVGSNPILAPHSSCLPG